MQIFDVQKLIFEVSEGPGGVQGRLWRAFGVPIGFFGLLMRKWQKFVGFWRQVGAQVGAPKLYFWYKNLEKYCFQKHVEKTLIFTRFWSPKVGFYEGAEPAKIAISLVRGVIFLKIRLSKLGAEKRGPGGGLGRPFWGPRWGQNGKNEVRKGDRKMSYF